MPAHSRTVLDFSGENFNMEEPWEFFDGCWVITHRHSAAGNGNLQLNNRTFIFRLHDARAKSEVLLVYGASAKVCVEGVQRLESRIGIPVRWIIGNGGQHHLFLELWYDAFPDARVVLPGLRIPHTKNGRRLADKYKERWELMYGPRPEQLIEAFGEQIDVLIFDQILGRDEEVQSAAITAPEDAAAIDKPLNNSGWKDLRNTAKLLSIAPTARSDEVAFFHRAAKLVIAGHNYQFSYTPRGYKPPPHLLLKQGRFPMSVLASFLLPKGAFDSNLLTQPAPLHDPAEHVRQWETVLAWPFEAWTSFHDRPTICGPDENGAELKRLIRKSLARTGEDDPTGARLIWNKKHGKKA